MRTSSVWPEARRNWSRIARLRRRVFLRSSWASGWAGKVTAPLPVGTSLGCQRVVSPHRSQWRDSMPVCSRISYPEWENGARTTCEQTWHLIRAFGSEVSGGGVNSIPQNSTEGSVNSTPHSARLLKTSCTRPTTRNSSSRPFRSCLTWIVPPGWREWIREMHPPCWLTWTVKVSSSKCSPPASVPETWIGICRKRRSLRRSWGICPVTSWAGLHDAIPACYPGCTHARLPRCYLLYIIFTILNTSAI